MSARERVREFLDNRATMRGLDPQQVHAANEAELTVADLEHLIAEPTFRRRIDFEKGYNYLHETGPGRRGQHGMGIRFLLVGPHGAAQFLMNTSWTPLGEVDEDKTFENGYHREPCHVDRWEKEPYGTFGYVRPPSGFDLGYHWATPQYPEQEEYARDNCPYIGGRKCYYDGSGLGGDEVLRDFIARGERAVWHHLVKRYRWCLEGMAEYEAEVNQRV